MKAFNEHLVPPGGFVFRERDGTELRATTLRALIQGVRRYRQSRGLPVGNPELDVHNALCSQYPSYCREVVSHHAPRAVETSVVERAARWAESPPETVADAAQIVARTKLCLACPAKVEWALNCRDCASRVREFLVRAGLQTGPAALQGAACLLAGDDLSAAVQLATPEPVVNPPARCWRSAVLSEGGGA